MKYTSAEANKLLKKIESRIADLEAKEEKSAVFRVASGEDEESLRPEYNFARTQETLDELETMARRVKHAINSFNLTHTLPGFEDLTIDQALVYLPQLNKRVNKLRDMAGAIPKTRIEGYGSTFVDYNVVNYDIAAAEEAYREAQEELAAVQLALDAANAGDTMDIDVEIN